MRNKAGITFHQLFQSRVLWHVERTPRTRHPVGTLLEELVTAPAMAEVEVAPRLPVGCCAAEDGSLVNEHFHCSHVAPEVISVRIRPRLAGSRRLQVAHRRLYVAVTEPGLQLKWAHWLLGIAELRSDRGTCAVAADGTARITLRYPSLPTQGTNHSVVQVIR